MRIRNETIIRNSRRAFLAVLAAGLCVPCVSAAAQPTAGEALVYFGTYTGFKHTRKGVPTGRSLSKGIYVSRFQASTGEITEPRLAAQIRNPSFLAIHPNRRYLYSVSEDPESLGPMLDKASFISAYAIDTATGDLRLLNTVPSRGTATCYLSVAPSGKYLLAASYGSGSLTVLRINDDGSIGEPTAVVRLTGHGVDPHYQEAPHAHSLDVTPDGRFAIACDLGTDKVRIYRFDGAAGTLTPSDPDSVTVLPPGAGPRHFAFAPGGKFGYALSEMSGIITAYAWDASNGRLTEIQAAKTMPSDFTLDKNAQLLNPFHSSEIEVHASGRFLYEGSRGPDTINVFAVDPGKGTLQRIQEVSTRGLIPRHFAIDPTGTYLFAANQASDDVVIFRIEDGTGRLTPTRSLVRVDTPVCAKFVPVK